MLNRQIKSFAVAFLAQKFAEYFLLSLCLTMHIYMGSRVANPATWGVFGAGNVNISLPSALLSGFGGSLIIFLFSLYPIVTFVLVALGRRLFRVNAELIVPWWSAAASVVYAVLWVAATTMFDFALLPLSYWIIMAVMAIFIFISSSVLYPAVGSVGHRGVSPAA